MNVLPEHSPFELQSIQTLKGVGPSLEKKLSKLGICNLQDVLFHLPFRYEDRTKVVPIGQLQPGQRAVFEGVVQNCEVRFGGRRKGGSNRSLLCYLSDGNNDILLRFFHFSQSQQAALTNGVNLRCFGEVRLGKSMLEVAHPEYRQITAAGNELLEQTLTPVYPSSEGVHQSLLRKLASQVFDNISDKNVTDWMPKHIREKFQFPEISIALRMLHRPPPDINIPLMDAGKHPLQRRLIFEELLAHQLSMLQVRNSAKSEAAIPLKINQGELDRFKERLNFKLTHSQEKVIAEILFDMSKPVPMMRLVQGDVGSGKTVVAAAAILSAVHHGHQVALMAPTEILVEQHFEQFSEWFNDKDVQCVLLTSKQKGKARKHLLSEIENGQINIVIGTHALFQDDVIFNQLSLLVVDEQHRFGVHQRLRLREKGVEKNVSPHQLIMTATPIPRSLTMTFYADLDCSIINELPKGRKPISTVIVSDARRQEVVDRIAEACKQGEQAYWVCTLIEESEFLQCQAAETTAQQLSKELSFLNIGLIHGRMLRQEKEEVMASFKNGEIHLLVATTVIEVGVDVPNASLMVIENPERLGLAQLHQLRGRIGRGEKKSACVLLYKPPLSQKSKQRLSVIRDNNSGFVISEKDLQMRGPGEVLGTRQTGLMQMRIADIVRDESLLSDVKTTAIEIMQDYPKCVNPIIARWLGESEKFSSV